MIPNNCKCTDDGSRSYRNVWKMSFISFSLAVIFIMILNSFLKYQENTNKAPNFTTTVTSRHFVEVRMPCNSCVVWEPCIALRRKLSTRDRTKCATVSRFYVTKAMCTEQSFAVLPPSGLNCSNCQQTD